MKIRLTLYFLTICLSANAQQAAIGWEKSNKISYNVIISEKNADTTYFKDDFSYDTITFDSKPIIFPYNSCIITLNDKDGFEIKTKVESVEEILFAEKKYRFGDYSILKGLLYDPFIDLKRETQRVEFDILNCVLDAFFPLVYWEYWDGDLYLDSSDVPIPRYSIPLIVKEKIQEDTVLIFKGDFDLYYKGTMFASKDNRLTQMNYHYSLYYQYSTLKRKIILADINLIVNSVGTKNIRKEIKIFIRQ